jgi:hypothetical protein
MDHSFQGDYRRERTRTLIQLGGLVQKSGLLEIFNLSLGQDLQKDVQQKEAALHLMGALTLLKTWMEDHNISQDLLLEKGKEALGK